MSVFPRFSYGGGQARMEIRVEEESCITEYRARINLLGKLNFVRMECVNIYIYSWKFDEDPKVGSVEL